MRHIVINNVRYPYPYHCESLSLGQLSRMEHYRRRLVEQSSPQELFTAEVKLLSALCGVPVPLVMQVDGAQRSEFLSRYLHRIYGELAPYFSGEKSIGIKEVGPEMLTLSGRERLPKLRSPLRMADLNGEPLPLFGISASAFCDASDLWRENPARYGVYIVAMLCLPHSATCSEVRLLRQARQLGSLKVAVLIALGEQLREAHSYYQHYYPRCYQRALPSCDLGAGASEGVTEGGSTSWSELLCWCAHYDPIQEQLLEGMPIARMMRLAHLRLQHLNP